MRRRASQLKPEMLGEILAKILKKRNIPHTSTDRRLLGIWRRAVGPQIASQTHPDSLKRGVLFVRVSAPVWMHQLQFMKEEILGKLKELTSPEEIHNLHFSIGEIPAPPPVGATRPVPDPDLPALAGRDRTMVRESIEAVRDPELRVILERVMAREIGRRRQREKQKAPGK
ncbi:MAG: DciA family protein [Syntrophales bacterium]